MANYAALHPADKQVADRRAALFNLQKHARESCDRLCAHLDGLDSSAFRRHCSEIMKSEMAPHLSWDKIFVEAARAHHVGALIHLESTCCVPSQDLLNRALEASLVKKEGEDAETIGKTAHYLVLWGADPNARSSSFIPFSEEEDVKPLRLHELAAIRGLNREREEMAIWAKEIKEDGGPINDASIAGGIIAERKKLKNASGKSLRRAIATALDENNLPAMMAAYAESRQSPWWRGKVTFKVSRDSDANLTLFPGEMILMALEKERYTLVTQMLRHGYDVQETIENGKKVPLTSTTRRTMFFPNSAPALAAYKLRQIENNNYKTKPVLPSRERLKDLVAAPGKSYTPFVYRDDGMNP